MAPPPTSDENLKRLRAIADRIHKPEPSPQLISLDFMDDEPTKIEQRPDTIPPKSLPARAAKGAADGWKATPRPVQIIAAVTALVGALTPIVLAILEALK